MVIKKIFNKQMDEEIHSDFLKYGRGEYKDKYLVEAKKQKDRYVIKTGFEYVNFLVRECLKKVSGNIRITGVIITTLDLKKEITFPIKKIGNFQGIKKIEIDSVVSSSEILELMKKYPRVFFALSFKTDDFEIKVKPKAPRSGKPGSKSEEDVKADFCTIKTSNQEIIKELLFDIPAEFKEVKVKHILKINEILYPKAIAGMRPEEVREKSKRKGIMIREADIDGSKKISEAEFEA